MGRFWANHYPTQTTFIFGVNGLTPKKEQAQPKTHQLPKINERSSLRFVSACPTPPAAAAPSLRPSACQAPRPLPPLPLAHHRWSRLSRLPCCATAGGPEQIVAPAPCRAATGVDRGACPLPRCRRSRPPCLLGSRPPRLLLAAPPPGPSSIPLLHRRRSRQPRDESPACDGRLRADGTHRGSAWVVSSGRRSCDRRAREEWRTTAGFGVFFESLLPVCHYETYRLPLCH